MKRPESATVTRIYYPESANTPFGELNLIRIDRIEVRGQHAYRSTTARGLLEVMAPAIVTDAWINADWLQTEVGKSKAAQLQEVEKQSGIREPFRESIAKGVQRSQYFPHKQVGWFALRPPSAEKPAIKGLGESLALSQVRGFASAKHDVSGNGLERAYKRLLKPEKVYANVSDVDVRTVEQSKGIGAALFAASLLMFKPGQTATTYLAASNEHLRAKLDSLGYVATGSQKRTNLISGATIDEVRMQAESVQSVQGKLYEQYPWLDEGQHIALDHLKNYL